MKIAIVTFPARSHLAAMVALGTRLRARDHEVSILGLPEIGAAVAQTALDFVAIPLAGWDSTAAYAATDALSRAHGDFALRSTINASAWLTAAWFVPLEHALREGRFDGVIFDDSHSYVAVVALRLGVPHAHVACAVHIDMTGRTPLGYTHWPSDDTAEAADRNGAAVKRLWNLLAEARRVGKAYASAAGLGLDWSDPAATTSRIAWITQVPRCFDFDRPSGPPNLIHAGPLRDDRLRPSVPFPWDRLGAAPLVYASMGTILTGHLNILVCIIEVARRRPDLQFVVATGDALDLDRLWSLPANVVLVRFAPQIDLLKRASLCITHGGLNTVLEALAEGVPLVAIPIAFDQPGVGSRLREKGAGEVVPLGALSLKSLGSAVDRVLDEPGFRESAACLRDGIAAADGLNRAATAIEAAFATATR